MQDKLKKKVNDDIVFHAVKKVLIQVDIVSYVGYIVGVIPNAKIFVVVHTVKEKGKGEIIRIISARKAIKAEAKEYFERI